MAKKPLAVASLAVTPLLLSTLLPSPALAAPTNPSGGECSDFEIVIAGSKSGEGSADDMLRRIADRVQRDGGSVGAFYADGEKASEDVSSHLEGLSDSCGETKVAFLGTDAGGDALKGLSEEIQDGSGPIGREALVTTVVMDAKAGSVPATAPSRSSTSGGSGVTSVPAAPARKPATSTDDAEVTSIPAAPTTGSSSPSAAAQAPSAAPSLLPGLGGLLGGAAPSAPAAGAAPSTSGTTGTSPSTSGTTGTLPSDPGVSGYGPTAPSAGALGGLGGLAETGTGLLGAFSGLGGMPEMATPGLGGAQPGGLGASGGLRKVQSSGLVESAATVAMGDLGHSPDTVVRSLSAAVAMGQVLMSINPMRVASLGTNAAAMAAEPNPMSAYIMAVDALAITASVATAWESNPALPQLMEFLDLIDPQHPLGQKVYAMMPEQMTPDQIKAIGIGVTVSRKVLELGPSRILSLGSQVADQTVRPNPLALPKALTESLTLATDLGMLLADPEVHQAGLTLTQLDPNQLLDPSFATVPLGIDGGSTADNDSTDSSAGGATGTSPSRGTSSTAGSSPTSRASTANPDRSATANPDRSATANPDRSSTANPGRTSSATNRDDTQETDGVFVVAEAGGDGEDQAVEHLLDKIKA